MIRTMVALTGLLLALGLLACGAVPPGRGELSEQTLPLPVADTASPSQTAVPPEPPAQVPAASTAPMPASVSAAPAAADAQPTAPVIMARGLASWYGDRFQGRRTASGERFDRHALTAAHRTLPFGTLVRVRSVRTGKEVVVRINDRGPHKPQRIIDLSEAAMRALGLRWHGVSEVELLPE